MKHILDNSSSLPALLGLGILVLFTACMGPWGFFGWLVLAMCVRPGKERSEDTQAKLNRIQRKDAHSRESHDDLLRRTREKRGTEANLDMLNYQEILINGSDFEKVNLISMLSFHPTARSVKLIQSALGDKNDGIRVIAATALQKMDHEYVTKIVKLQKELPGMELVLASTIDLYWRSGLMDETQEKRYLANALSMYEKSEALDRNSRIARIRLAIDWKAQELAESLVDQELSLRIHDADFLLLKAECQYKRREFEEVRETLAKIDLGKLRTDRRIYDVYSWWHRYSS